MFGVFAPISMVDAPVCLVVFKVKGKGIMLASARHEQSFESEGQKPTKYDVDLLCRQHEQKWTEKTHRITEFARYVLDGTEMTTEAEREEIAVRLDFTEAPLAFVRDPFKSDIEFFEAEAIENLTEPADEPHREQTGPSASLNAPLAGLPNPHEVSIQSGSISWI